MESLNCIWNLSEVANNILGSGFFIKSGVASENSIFLILLPVESPSNWFFDVWSHQSRNIENMCLSVFCSQTLELNHVILSQRKFFNFVLDNGARMLALCKFFLADRQTTEVTISTIFRADVLSCSTQRGLSLVTWYFFGNQWLDLVCFGVFFIKFLARKGRDT